MNEKVPLLSLPRTKCFTMSNSYFNIKSTSTPSRRNDLDRRRGEKRSFFSHASPDTVKTFHRSGSAKSAQERGRQQMIDGFVNAFGCFSSPCLRFQGSFVFNRNCFALHRSKEAFRYVCNLSSSDSFLGWARVDDLMEFHSMAFQDSVCN